jgi:hypothetical protein
MEEAEELKMVEEFGIPDIAGRDKGATLLYYWIVTLTPMKVKAIVNRIRYRTKYTDKILYIHCCRGLPRMPPVPKYVVY